MKFVIISDPCSILKRHQIIHGFVCLKKEFACDKCDVCGKGFTEARKVQGHKKIHTGIWRFQGSGRERKNTNALIVWQVLLGGKI